MASVTDSPDDLSTEYPEGPLRPWERWVTDETGESFIEFDTEAHAEWCEKWAPPCPAGNPQLPRHALGFRERSIGELELRVALGGDEGICQVIVDERDDEVYVRVVVCYEDEDDAPARRPEYMDCPARVWLDRPLGDRAVIDVDDDRELPLYVPKYLNGVIQPDHGYHPANRRRKHPEGSDHGGDVDPASRPGDRLR
jgi:hypothetical protein